MSISSPAVRYLLIARRACMRTCTSKCHRRPRGWIHFSTPVEWVGPNERVTVISDDSGEFGEAVQNSELARGRILDWFHIAMKFKAAETSFFGSAVIEPLQRESVTTEIEHAKWLVWHGKGGKSVARIKALDASLMPRKGYEFSTLWWNLHRLSSYIANNAGTLVNYGARYHKGLPISSSECDHSISGTNNHFS